MASNGQVAGLHRQLSALSVHVHAAVRHHFELRGAAQYSDALARHVVPRACVVDNDAEVSVDEVTCEQVAALAGEFEEALVESHEVLVADNARVSCNDTQCLCLGTDGAQTYDCTMKTAAIRHDEVDIFSIADT